jgi:hypothetical protein
MNVFIKEWPNKTATILTANGEVIWTFSSMAEARQACQEWHSLAREGKGMDAVNLHDDSTPCYCLT